MKRYYRTLVTPKVAEKWLKTNTKNRVIQKSLVDEYARDMEAGAWRENGDAIRFHKDGHLADGQHRLMAIIKSGISMECSVVEGLDDADQMTIDSGRKRTAGDNFAITGENYGSLLASTIKMLYGMATGLYSTRLTMTELIDILDAHPGIRDSASVAHKSRILRPSVMSAIYYIGKHFYGEKEIADKFLHTLVTGEASFSGDPAYVLRERLIEMRLRRVIPRPDWLGIASMHAYEAYRAKKPIKSLRIPEEFKIKGWTEEVLFTGLPANNDVVAIEMESVT